jgi:hypothetical protein
VMVIILQESTPPLMSPVAGIKQVFQKVHIEHSPVLKI